MISKFIDSINSYLNSLDGVIKDLLTSDNIQLFECITFLKEKSENGKIVVLGIGKTGLIGRKIASTLASTGTPSFFVSAAEAGHGDLGMITKADVVLAISQSGKSSELMNLLPHLKDRGVSIVSITASVDSPLAKDSAFCLLSSVIREGCPLNIAPMASTTKALIIGDMLAIGLMLLKGFTLEDFAKTHPFGDLGRRLSLTVASISKFSSGMFISMNSDVSTLLNALTEGGLGIAVCIDDYQRPIGIITDGDFRRWIKDRNSINFSDPINEIVNMNFKSVFYKTLATQVARFMQEYRVNVLPVVDEENVVVGIVSYRILNENGFLC